MIFCKVEKTPSILDAVGYLLEVVRFQLFAPAGSASLALQ